MHGLFLVAICGDGCANPLADQNCMDPQDSFEIDPDRSTINRLVALIIDEALEFGATEILLEQLQDRMNIQYRIDGVLHHRDSPPRALWDSILARLHTLAAQHNSQSIHEHITISSVPAEIEGPQISPDKYPVTLSLEFQQDSVRLIIPQGH